MAMGKAMGKKGELQMGWCKLRSKHREAHLNHGAIRVENDGEIVRSIYLLLRA